MQVARPTGYVPSADLQSTMGSAVAGALGAAGLPAAAAAVGAVLGGPPPPPEPATRFLVLENLLSDASLNDDAEYAECCADIKGECERFGAVTTFTIPRASELHGHPPSDVGKCFVTYTEAASAAKAYAQLHGRDFDGNKVKATFLPDPPA